MVVMHDGIPSILTEDVTQGETSRIVRRHHNSVFLKRSGGRGGMPQKFYVSFKRSTVEPNGFRYCTAKAVLAL